jgi:hypothetical protein
VPTLRPDSFPQTFDDTYSSEAPTSPGVGGTRHPSNTEQADAAGLLQRRRAPQVDPRASAALQRAIAQAKPRPIRLRGALAAPASGPTVIGLGGPEIGFTWMVTRVTAGPIDYSAGSFATGVFVILAITQTGVSTPDTAYEVVSTTAAWPAEGTWNKDQLQLQGGERLRLIITGLAAGVFATAGGQAYETAAGVTETYQI